MKENIVKTKSFDFSLIIIDLFKFLCKEKKEYVLSKQILRSGTAIGALVAESEYAQSKLDFIHKLSIAQKEANETMYWLELLFRSAYLTNEHRYEQIKTNLLEIQKIISSIIITTKNNLKK